MPPSARALLTRLLVSIEGRELLPGDRLRAGWPRAALLLWAPMPALIAGPLRFVYDLPLGWCFVLGAVLTLVAALPLARALRSGALPKRYDRAAHALLLVVAGFAAALTYNRHFHGLPQYLAPDGWGGADGGYHIMNYMDFTRRTHNAYGGFVSMYSFWDATRRLGSTHLVAGLNVCFAYVRIVVAVVPCTVALATLWRFADDARAWWSGAIACLVVTLAVQYLVILPPENFHLMGGFWPHLFGLVPLMLLWMADALVRQRLLRLTLALGCVLLYRYTYGLNLADVIGAIGALVVLEALDRRATAWWVRVPLVGVAAAAFWSARFCYLLTLRLFRGQEWGWIVDHDVAGAEHGMALAVVALAASVCLWPRASAAGSGLGRALRFPLFFVLADLVILTLIRRLPPGTTYYFQKYDFHALVLAAAAVVVAATFAVAAAVAGRTLGASARAIVLVAVAAAGVVTMHRAIAPFDGVFAEQVWGGPYARSYPWVMPATVRRIDQTLARTHEQFGGYLTRHYGTRLTTNALFDYGSRQWMNIPHADQSPGHCIFWDASRGYAQDNDAEKYCETYQQIPFGRLTVCSRCY